MSAAGKQKNRILYIGLVAGIFIGIFSLFFLTQYAIPCYLDPTDCSGRDIAMAVLTLPTSGVVSIVAVVLPDSWTDPISVQMFLVFLSGVIQYGALGVAFTAIVYWFIDRIAYDPNS